MEQFKGTGVALVTPFTEDNRVDYEALDRLVNYQIDNGIEYLVVLGTTGETATLSAEEKREIRRAVVKANRGRLPLVAGVGGNNTQHVLEELYSEDLSEYTAILSVSPYYNKPSQEGIFQHFKAIAQASPLPVILYNVPPRTGSNVLPATVFRLAMELDNIIGIKEAAGDMDQALELLKRKPEGFLVISGEDKLALPLTLAGGAGVISVIGQALPKNFSEMIRLGLSGDSKAAYRLYFPLSDSIDLIFSEGNPTGVKAMLESLGITGSGLRLPLVPASEELRQKINNFVRAYKY